MARPTLTDVEVDQVRERICDAAGRLFSEQGFANVGLRTIGSEIGLTGAALYRYFPQGREEIVAAVRARAFRKLADLSQEAVAACSTPLEWFARWPRPMSTSPAVTRPPIESCLAGCKRASFLSCVKRPDVRGTFCFGQPRRPRTVTSRANRGGFGARGLGGHPRSRPARDRGHAADGSRYNATGRRRSSRLIAFE